MAVRFEAQAVPGCYVVSLDPVGDDRGFFARIFARDEFADLGLVAQIEQINLARSEHAGTIRGIHRQEQPYSEAKLIRCVRGRIFDVCVDLRPGSNSWGEWVGVELSDQNRLALYVPPGCGNAYQTLTDEVEVLYSTSAPYMPSAERGARWDDPTLSIDWPLTDGVTVSEKDRSWPDLSRP